MIDKRCIICRSFNHVSDQGSNVSVPLICQIHLLFQLKSQRAAKFSDCLCVTLPCQLREIMSSKGSKFFHHETMANLP